MLESKRYTLEEVLGDIKSEDSHLSLRAADKLISKAREAKMDIKNYLRFSVNPTEGDYAKKVIVSGGRGLNGYELALSYLGLPVKDDIDAGISLKAADDAFKTFEGVRAFFPPVIDDVLQWKMRMPMFSTLDQLVAQSTTIDGNEIISTVIEDGDEGVYDYSSVSEGGRIPIMKLRASDKSVKFFKHGRGIETTYEFIRRVKIEMLVPYWARMARKTEESKIAHGTSILINGDGVHGAAPVYNQLTDGGISETGLQYFGLLNWFTDRATAGAPIDTVIGNAAMSNEWMKLFLPTLQMNSAASAMAAKGGPQLEMPQAGLFNPVKFVISNTVPNNRLIGITKGETLEYLNESGSNIQESEQMIRNQTVTVVRSENGGFRLVFGDTRSVYQWSNT